MKEAFEIWTEALGEASEIVDECREQIRMETAKVQMEGTSDELSQREQTDNESSDEPEE